MRHIRVLPALALILAGCGGPATASSDENPTGDDDDDDITNVGDDDDDGPITFESDIIPLFERSCGAGDNNCHSRVAYHADDQNDCKGWLSLENSPLGSVSPSDGTLTGCPDLDLYDRLMQLGSWQCFVAGAPADGIAPTEWKYVAPGDLDGSYLWQKVNRGILCELGNGNLSDYMPLALNLPQEDLDLIEAWILGGALRDSDTTTNTDPVTCTITTPTNGDSFPFYEQVTLSGSCTEGASLDWTLNTRPGSFGTSGSITIDLPADGSNTITLRGTLGNEVGQAVITLTSLSPVVRINHPGDGEVRNVSNGAFPFVAEAVDRQDGDISGSIRWWSSIDGAFGNGGQLDYLPGLGVHDIWAEVQDSDGNVADDTISIEMIP